MNTPFDTREEETVAEHHNLTQTVKREDVMEARRIMHELLDNERTKEAGILIATEILSRTAIERQSDFVSVTEVNPSKVGGREGIGFEITVEMTVNGKK